jgi:SSS family transporter
MFKYGWELSKELAGLDKNTKVYQNKKLALDQYFNQSIEDFKFNKDILAFHTITKKWVKLDEYPFPGPVGHALVKQGHDVFVVNGEVKAGVRTDRVVKLRFENKPQFGIVNYIVLIAYLLSMLYLGFYFMKRSKSTDDYFKAGGRIPWWAAGISIFATTLSAITFMSLPAKTYISDWRYFPMAVTIFVVAPFIIRYYLPYIRRLNLTSAYEYLEIRFSLKVRALAAFLFAVFMVSRIAIVLFLPSIALASVTGINVYTCILLMGVITIAYSTIGGVEAVVWGDVIQGIVLVGGALISIVFLVLGTDNGFMGLVEISTQNNKMQMLDFAFDFSQPTFWVMFFGGFALSLISYTSDQSVVQRYITTASSKEARKSIWFNGIIAIPVSLAFYFIGTSLYSFYTSNPERINVYIENNDAIFPEFIMNELPVGIAGILIAAIFSATMSTLSSNLNSVATVFTTDFYKRFKSNTTDAQCLKVAKTTNVLAGLVGMALAILLATWDIKSLFDYFNTILGLFSSGIGALFIMGMMSKSFNSTGAIVGVFVGAVCLVLVKYFTMLHFFTYGLIGLLVSIVSAYIISIFARK